MRLPGAGLHQLFPDPFRDEETITPCPACHGAKVQRCGTCKGAGQIDLKPVGPSQYRGIQCTTCKGQRTTGRCELCNGIGAVSSSKASDFRRKALDSASGGR